MTLRAPVFKGKSLGSREGFLNKGFRRTQELRGKTGVGRVWDEEMSYSGAFQDDQPFAYPESRSLWELRIKKLLDSFA